jgi:type IV pilus assembly protein PilW
MSAATRSLCTMRRQRGLTLVELMVALMLSLVMLGGLVGVFVANKRTYQLQTGLSRLQESGRFATHMLSQDLRGAGYLGCGTKNLDSGAITNTLNSASDYAYSYGQSVDGFEATSSSTWSPTLDSSITSATGGSDVLTLRYAVGGGARVTRHNTPSADLQVTAGASLEKGDIVLVSDCERGAIFQISNVQNVSPTQTNIVHNTGTIMVDSVEVPPGNATTDLGKKYLNAEIVAVRVRTYYVRTGADGGPSLWRVDNGGTPQELIPGVEQMQVLYGVDNDNDLAIDAYVKANSITDWGNVISVKVSLLVRSSNDNVTESPQAYTFNGSTVTPSDNHLRHAFTTTIAIRNHAG